MTSLAFVAGLLPLLFAPLGVGFAAYGGGRSLWFATFIALLTLPDPTQPGSAGRIVPA